MFQTGTFLLADIIQNIHYQMVGPNKYPTRKIYGTFLLEEKNKSIIKMV